MTRRRRKRILGAAAFICSISAASIFSTYALLQNEQHRIATALKDGQYAEALARLEQADKAEGSPNRLLELYRLYVWFGKVEEAALSLEEFISEHPEEIWALRELSEFYRSAQQPDRYIDTLWRLMEQSPDRKVLAQLIGHYRLIGDTDRELQLFEQATYLGLADKNDIASAALIYAQLGELEKAEALLSNLGLSKAPEDIYLSQTRFYILLDLGRPEEALDLALQLSESFSGQIGMGALASALEHAGFESFAAKVRLVAR